MSEKLTIDINAPSLGAVIKPPVAREGGGGSGGAVDSVNGQTGDVILNAEDVGALPNNTTAADLGAYVKPSGGIPASDLAPGVIPSVPAASSTTPLMDGNGSAGSAATYARADHVHPSDTSRLAANQGTANAGKFMVVGSDGIVAPVTMQTWQGGSY